MEDSNDPKAWFDKAKDDLRWTESNLRGQIWYGACFTAQQAAEKALKAYILNKGLTHPKIHDLGALLERCTKLDSSFAELKEECVVLTDYYVPIRYPTAPDLIDFTQELAKEAYEFAKEIVEFVEEQMK